ncbi:hypothetical protein Vafri_14139, partial [Volvox africanus]
RSCGMAVVETVTGDLLGPWLPLLAVPSEEIAAELNSLSAREQFGGVAGFTVLLRFLKDLGLLLGAGDGGDDSNDEAAGDECCTKKICTETTGYDAGAANASVGRRVATAITAITVA